MEGGEKIMDDFLNSLNELQNDLQEKANKVENLNGTRQIAFNDLFTDELMQNKTRFKNIESFLELLDIKSSEDLNDFPQEKLDIFVNENTDFSNWNEMRQYAVTNYISQETGIDFN